MILIRNSLIFERFVIYCKNARRPVKGRRYKRISFGIKNVNFLELSSAIKKGYFVDNFAEEFTLYRGKRDIIIHRGYWARVFIVRKLIETMIQHGKFK